jgi:hypothetical protein
MSPRQNPIVAHAEALFWRCDALEARLHQTRTLGATSSPHEHALAHPGHLPD